VPNPDEVGTAQTHKLRLSEQRGCSNKLCLCVVFVWGRVWAEKPRGFVQQPEMSVDVCTGEGSRLL